MRDQLEKHLAGLKRSGLIDTWHDRKIVAGDPLDATIMQQLEESDIVLLLVSADFINSDYCYGREMTRALERHSEGSCVVVPVILRACDWAATPLRAVLATPRDGKPIMQWRDRDKAFLDVAHSVRAILEKRVASKLDAPHRPSHGSLELRAPQPQHETRFGRERPVINGPGPLPPDFPLSSREILARFGARTSVTLALPPDQVRSIESAGGRVPEPVTG